MIVGIDLGTTNSLVAYFTEDGPKIIPNRLGKNLTPSIVSIDEDEQVYVGERTRERLLCNPTALRPFLSGIWEARESSSFFTSSLGRRSCLHWY